MNSTSPSSRILSDAPEHTAFMAHACPTCLVGGRCRVSDELMRAADAEDWQRIGGGGTS